MHPCKNKGYFIQQPHRSKHHNNHGHTSFPKYCAFRAKGAKQH